MNCEYQHKVNKKEIPVCNILGVNIAAINMEWLLDFTDKNIKDLSGDYMCVSNVHTTVTSYDDPDYCAVQNGGIMAIPDGGPLSTVGRKRGCQNMERTTGPSYLGEILKISAEKGYRHYFYGSTEETLEKLYKALNENYPGIQIAGMYSPPFRPTTPEEDAAVVKRINESGVICDEWKEKDNRINVVHKKNAGLGFARNSGLEVATGDYVMFIDSDDYIASDMIERLYDVAVKTNSDTVYCGLTRVFTDGSKTPVPAAYNNQSFEGEEIIDKVLLEMVGSKPEESEDAILYMSVSTMDLFYKHIR